ncbi:unnamed protein product [Symbiodinium sp. CCMP2592]|nr:unnamed protein product [Symbiodinium sp. CCMP2592]
MTPAGEARFTEGSRVILHGLRANEIFNNRRGKVLKKLALQNSHGPIAAYEVCLTDGQLVKALDANLDLAPPLADAEAEEESWSDDGSDHVDLENLERAKLMEELFQLLDQSQEGTLRSQALHHLAVACGFEGGPVKWEEEYQALCKLFGTSPGAGFQQMEFAKLLSNEALPTYCPTDELADLVASTRQHIISRRQEQTTSKEDEKRLKAEQYRKDAVKFIFKSLDMDGDGFLNGSEMQRFAELCGFDDEWEVEYEVMCEHMGIAKEHGASLADFHRLVSERKSHAFCTRKDLRNIASQIRDRRESISRKQAAIRIQACTRGSLTRNRLQRQQTVAAVRGPAPSAVPEEKDRGVIDVPEPPPAPPESESEDSSKP